MKKFFTIAIIALSINAFAQVPTSGLIGWYPFNGNANDESGLGFHGTNKGAVLTADRFGNANSAYNFNGTSSYLDFPLAVFNSTTVGSISIWIQVESTSQRNAIFHVGDSTGIPSVNANVYGLNIYESSDPNTGNMFVHQVDTRICGGQNLWGADNSYLFETGNWQHIVLISDGTQTRYFRNGVEVPSLYTLGLLTQGKWIDDLCNNPNYFWIGKSKRTSEIFYFDGNIDDIGIWNRVLTDTEVLQLFNVGICYETITVTDTLIINANLTGFNPVAYQNTIKIYPNPSNDHITIDFGSNYSTINGYTLKITNSLSQIVYSTPINIQSTTVDLSTWTGNGIYFVHIIDGQGNTIDIKKIVLQ